MNGPLPQFGIRLHVKIAYLLLFAFQCHIIRHKKGLFAEVYLEIVYNEMVSYHTREWN